jgi:excinuclease ABC subunit C
MKNKNLNKQIKCLPLSPGVYLFKDKNRRILYIGKAAHLRTRVRSYFNRPLPDPRLETMINKTVKINHILCESEIEALILESELIRRHKPKYNIDWKDDKNFLYIMITKEVIPRVAEVRPPLTTKALYFGPFTDADALRNTLKTLRRIFPYRSCLRLPHKACLQYFIKRCPAPCIGIISREQYKKLIKNLIKVLSGKKSKVIKEIEKEMKKKASKKEFEKATVLRDKLYALKKIRKTIIFDQASLGRLKSDEALTGLAKLLNLKELPRRIEAYDVSNIAGKLATGSMIVFEDGLPYKKEYKRFKIRRVQGIDDYKMMREILERRFRKFKVQSSKFKVLPDLIVIDGGKGQLSVALDVLRDANLEMSIPAIGLAKREEEIITKKQDTPASPSEAGRARNKLQKYKIIKLPKDSKVLHLLQRIRDEAHRFAIFYHTKLREKAVKKSALDKIPGVGPKTKKLLLKKFSSIKNIKEAKQEELIKTVGKKKADFIRKNLL